MMDKRTINLTRAYAKLETAMAAVSDEPKLIQATEVLGFTGPWTTAMTAAELSEVIQQLQAELHGKLEDI